MCMMCVCLCVCMVCIMCVFVCVWCVCKYGVCVWCVGEAPYSMVGQEAETCRIPGEGYELRRPAPKDLL